MKITILSGGISSKFEAALLLRLKDENHSMSVIINKRFTIKIFKENIIKYGLKRTLIEGARKYIFKQYSIENKMLDTHLDHYLIKKNLKKDCLKKLIKKNIIPYIFVDDINSKNARAFCSEIKPDILIFAGGGIIRDRLIEVPNIGILNAHMGLLPKYRGMNVLEWSLFNNDPLGITIHFIDRGIDTGKILLRKSIPIDKNDSINSLRAKSVPLSVEALAEAIKKIEKKEINVQIQKKEEGKQYFVMHKRLKDIVENRLLSGSCKDIDR